MYSITVTFKLDTVTKAVVDSKMTSLALAANSIYLSAVL